MSNYPHWMKQAPIVGQNPAGELRWQVWNRTGSSTRIGGLYQFDLGLTTTSTSETDPVTGNVLPAVTTYEWLSENSCWRNIVLPATNYLRQGVFCRADEVVADNERLWVTVISPSTTLTTSDTLKSNGTDAQDDGAVATGGLRWEPQNATDKPLQPLNSSSSRVVGLNLTGFTVASGDVASVPVMFNGWGF